MASKTMLNWFKVKSRGCADRGPDSSRPSGPRTAPTPGGGRPCRRGPSEPSTRRRGADAAAGDEDPVGRQPLQSPGPGVAQNGAGHPVDLVEMDGKKAGPVGDALLGSEPVEGVRTRVDEPVGAAGHTHAAAGAALGTESQPGPAESDPVRPHQCPLRPIPVEDPRRASARWWQRAGPFAHGEEFGQIVVVSRQGHLVHGGAVVRPHLAQRHGPQVERGLRERHDLGPPHVGEPAVGPRNHGGLASPSAMIPSS